MKRLIILLLLPSSAMAVPVVPNFSQGLVSSSTQSKTVVRESIVSESYRTGFEYTVSGTGVENTIVSPPINGTTLTLSDRGSWKQTTPGAAFQYAETYSGPGLIEKVMIERETIIESVTDSTSTFSQ